MTGQCGKWIAKALYADAIGADLAAVEESLKAGELESKLVGGEEYVWVEDPDSIGAGEASPEVEIEIPLSDDEFETEAQRTGYLSVEEKEADSDDGAMDDESDLDEVQARAPLVASLSPPERLAVQAERAISLVERSLNTFMMMHEEVVYEKERFAQASSEGLAERDRTIMEKEDRIGELEVLIQEKEQEIADLKMLVEILEGQAGRKRSAPETEEYNERANVGDLMEDQLRYIMEDQMIQELLKE